MLNLSRPCRRAIQRSSGKTFSSSLTRNISRDRASTQILMQHMRSANTSFFVQVPLHNVDHDFCNDHDWRIHRICARRCGAAPGTDQFRFANLRLPAQLSDLMFIGDRMCFLQTNQHALNLLARLFQGEYKLFVHGFCAYSLQIT